MCYRKGFSLDV
ncbi:hypothetical protein F383_06487 [Gossypium arboreum]|uniref:Uncharacterized protein n=1 Tax=Gossypium arboreum TaxID=29729 RepID=A0A0B0PPD7_GOSAR|nr:hypothetical protein F383_06487 [Gossypium arboreum]